MNLSKAVIGTEQHACIGEETQILHSAGINGLRRLAGFTPKQMPVDENMLPPILSCYAEASSYLAVTLCSNPAVRSHPRIPYLVLAWMFIGNDNPARLTQHIPDSRIVHEVALLFIEIASGGQPSLETLNTTIKKALKLRYVSEWNPSAKFKASISALNAACELIKTSGNPYELLNRSPVTAAHFLRRIIWDISATHLHRKTQVAIQKRTLSWLSLNEKEQWRVTQSLMFDCL